MSESTSLRPTTFRWLAIEIAKANGSPYHDCKRHWIEKARKVAAAERTVAGVNAALVNFPWMASLPIDKRFQFICERILKAMEGREFVEELPKSV